MSADLPVFRYHPDRWGDSRLERLLISLGQEATAFLFRCTGGRGAHLAYLDVS
ncbi:hypothetical protein [Streptomyces nigra]|uniref:hypothetical protein n=1 Tax=Streptomyces nigra TaxID=1827580 RepID=UPI00365C7E5C